MRTIILLSLVSFTCAVAIAGLPPTSTKGQSGSKSTTFNFQVPFNQFTKTGGVTALLETGDFNMISNPGFEATTFSTGWTASGGTLSAATGVDIGFGLKGASWDASAAAQTLKTTLVSVPSGVSGANGEASIYYKTNATDYSLLVLDQSGNVINGVSLPYTASGAFAKASVNFAFGSASQAQISIVAGSNASAIHLDQGYLGGATNIGSVAQSRYVGGIRWFTANCLWSNNASNSPLLPSADSDCASPTVDGFAVAPGTGVPQVTFNNLTIGKRYVATLAANVSRDSGTNTSASIRFSDGTNDVRAQCYADIAVNVICPASLEYSFQATSSSITMSVNLVAGSGTAGIADIDAATNPVEIRLYEYPATSEVAVRADLAPAYWSGYHDNTCGAWTRTSATLGAFSADASCGLAQTVASNITCVASGSVLPEITCTFPRPGVYKVCAGLTLSNGTAGQTGYFSMYDGTSTISEGFYQNDTRYFRANFCGTSTVSGTTKTFSVYGAAGSGAININSGVTRAIDWSVTSETQNTQTPLLIGSVSSGASSMLRFEAAYITNTAGTPALGSQTSSWISSVTDNGVGNYTLNFAANQFSSAPFCMVNCDTADAIPRAIFGGTTSSAVLITCDDANTGSRLDAPAYVFCLGAR